MKIAITISGLTERGGTHKQVLRLCEYLVNRGEDVTIFTYAYDPEQTFPGFKKMPIVVLNENQNGGAKGRVGHILHRAKNILSLLRATRKYDLINIHDGGFEREISLISKLRKTKIVWQINDLAPCFQVGSNKDFAYEERFAKQRKVICKAAACTDQITVNVTKNADRVKEHLHQDAKVFYCGVDTNDQLKKHSFPKDKAEFRILSSGVFFPYRNYETQVKVIAKLRKNGVPIRLDIIGNTKFSPDYAGMIQNMIKEEGLEDYIKIWGQVDESVYTDLHDRADLFTFVNIDQSWGLAVFEAMSCGLPVLVSNSVGATEILHDDVDAVFVDPVNVDEIADRIQALLTDEAYYTRISQNAAEATPKFTWDNMYSSKMLELFEKFIQEKNV